MVTPHTGDDNAPTQRIEPTAPTAQAGPSPGATRWVTRVLRPGSTRDGTPPTRVADPGSPPRATRVERTASPAARSRGTGAPGGGEDAPWWRSLFGPLLDWMARLVSRVVVGPASDLDYAVPAELRRRYQVLDRIGAGGEAVVYLVEPADSPGRRLALKVYRPGHDINRELLDRLRARGTASPHTPAIHGYGHATSSWDEALAWEAQEYFAHGTLRTVIDGAPVDEARARAVVSAVAECLRHWQDDLQHNHTDVKPENLLVRSLDPPVLALTDFGGAVRATMSRVYGGLAITEDYAAPEVVEGRREAPGAWWALGVMAHELVTGRRPDRGGNWLTARNTEVDISAVADEHWRLLVRGLLAPSPSARWGHAEVSQWLAGERPAIRTARRLRPIVFAGASHEDPPSLAFDLLDRSDTGALWLRTHWSELRTWLDREVKDHTFDRAYLTGLEGHPERAHIAISALAARYVPGMPPRFHGHEISADGLLELATGEASRHAVVREAVESGAVGLAAQHWCPHPGCRTDGSGRCVLLERVQHEVPLLMGRVTESLDRITGGGGDRPDHPAAHEIDTTWARAVELVLDPEIASRHRALVRRQSWHPAQRSTAPHAPWWTEQRRTGLREGGTDPLASRAALLTAVLLLPEAVRIGGSIADRERADGRARRQDRWAALTGSARERWDETRTRMADTRRRRAEAATGDDPAIGGTAPQHAARRPPWGGWGAAPDPNRPDQAGPEGSQRARDRASRRVQRTMRQIQKAMTAGRCRRFAYPAALLGLVDGLGRALRPADGFYPESAFVTDAYTGLVEGSRGPILGSLSEFTGAVTGLLPGDTGAAWWLPVLTSIGLIVLGRTAASTRAASRARRRLAASRLAVVGSVFMLVVLSSTGLLMLGSGVLIPLDGLLG
ncbi:protein kinase domain-containing protein [Nocardiopsis lambiniae]|uniref:non-specific serine/threonine protein kinase n=1 Tax=Nocardiopsis lambiniae TaxID=3075539 RepID=A0ABU2M3Q4_9ACTN|nr:serine/threonine protein kinase [Nocardiopsis sp. DSM 44743]MDT0327270.1 serine/threonine protein kinase [Nocardiopsis sp. DSM 44743]